MLRIPAIRNAIRRVHSLNDPSKPLPYTVSDGSIDVTVPATAPEADVSVVCVEVKGMPAVLADRIA